jgi:hypothetical protein
MSIRVVAVAPPAADRADPQTDRMDPDWVDGETFWEGRYRMNHTRHRGRVDYPQTDRMVPDGMDGGHGACLGRKTDPHQVDPDRDHTPHRLDPDRVSHTPLRVVSSAVWVGAPHQERHRPCS